MLLTLVAVAGLQTSRLQLGTAWGGEQTLHFSNKDEGIDETHRFKLGFKITGKEEGMWTVERSGKMLETIIDKTSIPPFPRQNAYVTKQYLAPQGFLLDAEPFESGGFNLDRLIHFWLPSHLPDAWTVELGGTLNHVVNKATATFKLAVRPTKTKREYLMEFTEKTGMHGGGVMVFDVATGRLLSASLKVSDARMPGGMFRANVTYAYRDVKVEKPPR